MDAAIVPNFVVVDTDYRTLPALLVGEVPDFTVSEEYAAVDHEARNRPEPVFRALVRLCIRLHKQEMAGRLRPGERATLEQIHRLFERIARDGTVSRRYTLVTAMFDTLAQAEGWLVLPGLKERFGPETRRLLGLWIK